MDFKFYILEINGFKEILRSRDEIKISGYDNNKKLNKNESNNFVCHRYVFGVNEWYEFEFSFKILSNKKIVFYEVSSVEAKKNIEKQMKLYSDLWNTAYNLSLNKHENQLDKAGQKYFLHPLHVSQQFEEIDLKIVAIMHDLIEDTDVTLLDLLNLGFPNKILKAMESISRNKNEKYFDYINRVSKNNIAKIVKIKDLEHNLDISRFKNEKDINYDLIKRYKKALKFLKNE